MLFSETHSKFCAIVLFCVVLCGFPGFAGADLIPVLGGQRVGISGLQFLKVGVGARAVALGGAYAAVADDASALHWNPAGITQSASPLVYGSYTDWPVELSHRFAGAVYPMGVNFFGVSVTQLTCPETEVTTEMQPDGTGEMWRYGDLAAAVTFARAMTDRFSFGLTVRLIEETLDLVQIRAVTFDLGTFYRTGWGSSRFAVVLANFGGDSAPSGSYELDDGSTLDDFQAFSPPTEFRLGLATEFLDRPGQRVTGSLQLNHPNDNAENLGVGVEYLWSERFFLRGGMRLNSDAESYALGGGVLLPVPGGGAHIDYAYSSMGYLGSAHRISMELEFR